MLLLLAVCGSERYLDITTNTLKDGRVGTAYADTVRTTGGRGRVTVRVISGQLPPGIGLRSQDSFAVLDGTPNVEGQYLFTVEARDRCEDSLSGLGQVVSQGFSLTIQP
ncbi:hypothetical protein FJY69_09995 [candidate division WOR-3 bacterium]|nr:hypothetical protein [candidate division WOR-3 bacterium]